MGSESIEKAPAPRAGEMGAGPAGAGSPAGSPSQEPRLGGMSPELKKLKLGAAEECLKFARYTKLAARLFEDAAVAANSGDYAAAAELAQTAARLAEMVVEHAREVAAQLKTAAMLANEPVAYFGEEVVESG